MTTIKHKKLVDSNSNVLRTVNEEILMTADNIYEKALEIEDLLKNAVGIPVFRYFILNNDETIRADITEDVLPGGNIEIRYEKGRRVSGNFSISGNFDEWFPRMNNSRNWIGTKFRIDYGIVIGSVVYWRKIGVVTPTSVEVGETPQAKNIAISFADKRALLDGTIGGSLEKTYEIPNQTNIQDAIESMLLLDRGDGKPFDIIKPIFPYSYADSKVQYRYSQTPGGNLWDVIQTLCNLISCDAGYDENGSLYISANRDDVSMNAKPVIWYFGNDATEILNRNLTVDYSKAVNTVYVEGANVNGAIFDAMAQNDNPLSPCNINTTHIVNSVYVSDSNIYSDELAQDRADYELISYSRQLLSFRFTTAFLPIFDVNSCIGCNMTDGLLKMRNEILLIDSISLSSEYSAEISLGLINVKELPFR